MKRMKSLGQAKNEWRFQRIREDASGLSPGNLPFVHFLLVLLLLSAKEINPFSGLLLLLLLLVLLLCSNAQNFFAGYTENTDVVKDENSLLLINLLEFLLGISSWMHRKEFLYKTYLYS